MNRPRRGERAICLFRSHPSRAPYRLCKVRRTLIRSSSCTDRVDLLTVALVYCFKKIPGKGQGNHFGYNIKPAKYEGGYSSKNWNADYRDHYPNGCYPKDGHYYCEYEY